MSNRNAVEIPIAHLCVGFLIGLVVYAVLDIVTGTPVSASCLIGGAAGAMGAGAMAIMRS